MWTQISYLKDAHFAWCWAHGYYIMKIIVYGFMSFILPLSNLSMTAETETAQQEEKYIQHFGSEYPFFSG